MDFILNILLYPFRSIPFYSAPGNHDVWSDASAKLFGKYTGHPLHYSFDYGPAAFHGARQQPQ